MSSTQPDVSIIIVSWNTRDLLLQCLLALPDALGSLNADVWVVDNGSADGSVEAVRTQVPAATVIRNQHNLGFAAANNQAIKCSTGRYVLLLNSDTIAHPRSIELLVRFADAHPAAGAVGPMLLNPDGTFQGAFTDFPSLLNECLNVTGLGRRIYGRWYPNYGPTASQTQRRVDVIQGACMLVRRAALHATGLMDETYFMYSEEVDWCFRLWRCRWEVWYLPSAHIYHYGGQSTRQVRREMVLALYRSKIRFMHKHYGATPAAALRAIFFVALSLKWLLGRVHLRDRFRTA